MNKTAAGVAILAATLAGCSGGLKGDDPNGYAACRALDQSKAIKGTDGLGLLLVAGEKAAKANDDAIRGSAKAMFDDSARAAAGGKQMYLTDSDKLQDACAAAGYDFKN